MAFNTLTGSDWALALRSARERRKGQANRITAQLNHHMRTNITPSTAAKWAHKREACVKALKAGWSIHAISRAYELPEYMVANYREEENIPPYTGPKKPTPDVGQILA